MKKLLVALLMLAVCGSLSAQNDRDSIYIPKDLNDCLRTLDSMLSDSTKAQICLMTESDFKANSHFGLGMWIRNNWGLWSDDSPISEYLTRCGLFHPDDMSGVILTTYHRHLTGKPLKVNEQISHYRKFWKNNGVKRRPIKLNGRNNKTLQENAAFLDLPRTDSATGAYLAIRERRSTPTPQDSAYILRHTAQPAGLPDYSADQYDYHGNVKSILRTYHQFENKYTLYAEFDRQHRLVKCWVSDFDNYTLHYDSLGRIQYKIEYYETPRPNYPNRDTSAIYRYVYNPHGYTIYQASPVEEVEDYNIFEITDSELVSEHPDDFYKEYILDENGRPIMENGLLDHYCTQYNSMGHVVSFFEYEVYDSRFPDRWKDRDTTQPSITRWSITIRDYKNQVAYTCMNGENNVLCSYADRHGHITHQCYQDARNQRRLRTKVNRIRYDRHGNPKKIVDLLHNSTTRTKYKYYR